MVGQTLSANNTPIYFYHENKLLIDIQTYHSPQSVLFYLKSNSNYSKYTEHYLLISVSIKVYNSIQFLY